MTTFVLVHGAWNGAHGFTKVRRLLRAAGHEVFTPSLTGLGERSHLSSPQVNLTTHVLDVSNQILYEDLHDIVLLGFSYGGFVVTGALEHIADRVSHLVYLDAFVPNNGETLMGLVNGLSRLPFALGQSWQLPITPRVLDRQDDTDWIRARSSPQPLQCFTEPVYLAKPLDAFPFTRTYIKATRNPPDDVAEPVFAATGNRLKASPAWRYDEIATSHMVATNQPEALVKVLTEVSRSTPKRPD
jgi:pimeloyl-ACP methyl ester carboxylesterase